MGINRIQDKIILVLILLQVLGCGSKEKKDIMGPTTTAAEKESTDKAVTKLVEALGGSQVKLSSNSPSFNSPALKTLPDGWSGPDEEGYYTISTTKLSGGALSKLTITLFKLKATSTADSSGSTTELFVKIDYTNKDIKGHIDIWDKSYQKSQQVGQAYNYSIYDDGTIKWAITSTNYKIDLTAKYNNLPYQTTKEKIFPGLIISGETLDKLQISVVMKDDYSGVGTITKSNGRKVATIYITNFTSGYYTLESENNSKQYQFSLL